jgi:peptide/nickel transport system ATP-binding protein
LTTPLLETRNLVKYYPLRSGLFRKVVGNVHAVDNVSFSIAEGQTLGVVGESGCGKTTAARLVACLIKPTSGSVIFEGKDISRLTGKDLRKIRADLQMVFQDPQSSLNPRMTVKDTVAEPLKIHGKANGTELRKKVQSLLEKVGLNPDHMYRFPHEFSGGQRQRVGIARAIALNPKLLILDEPTSSLDVSVQAQILNLLRKLQSEMRLTYLFISHDLAVIKHMSDFIAVMYLGKVVEKAIKQKIFQRPLHPYTQALLASIQVPDPDYRPEIPPLKGTVPSSVNPPSGCRFHTRCPFADHKCEATEPDLIEVEPEHLVACHSVNNVCFDAIGPVEPQKLKSESYASAASTTRQWSANKRS